MTVQGDKKIQDRWVQKFSARFARTADFFYLPLPNCYVQEWRHHMTRGRDISPLLKGGGTRGIRKSKTDGSKIFLLAFLQNFYYFTYKLLCPTVSLNANNYHNIHNFTLAFHFLIISLLRQKCRLNFYFTLYRSVYTIFKVLCCYYGRKVW